MDSVYGIFIGVLGGISINYTIDVLNEWLNKKTRKVSS